MENTLNELKLKHIANKYFNYHSIASNTPHAHITFLSNNVFGLSFCNRVELAYSSLTSPLKVLINNDFFYQAYPGWWKSIYTKRQYNRLKRKAVIRFMEAFYEICN